MIQIAVQTAECPMALMTAAEPATQVWDLSKKELMTCPWIAVLGLTLA
jgi:hypothetical protein